MSNNCDNVSVRSLLFMTSALRRDSIKIAAVFRRNIRPRRQTPDLMLQLPPEIRIMIYRMVFPRREWSRGSLVTRASAAWRIPPLLQVSTTIRCEAMPVYFRALGNFTLFTYLDRVSFDKVAKRLAGIVLICGPKVFETFTLDLFGAVWPNLESLLPMLELMRVTGFEPAAVEYKPKALIRSSRALATSSVFLVYKGSGNLEFVLEKALSLARLARAQGWSAEKLAKLFTQYVQERRNDRGKKLRIVMEGKLL